MYIHFGIRYHHVSIEFCNPMVAWHAGSERMSVDLSWERRVSITLRSPVKVRGWRSLEQWPRMLRVRFGLIRVIV